VEERSNEWTDTPEERATSARRVLDAYRERRRHRRAPDVWYGDIEGLLAGDAGEIGAEEYERRRSEVLDAADEIGMPLDLAAKLYEIAREETLDPILAFELVRTGLAVCPPPGGITTEAEQPTTDRYLPPWMFPPLPTDDLLRERTLRFSFRRLHVLLAREPSVEAAFDAFAREPDVGHCGY
jgi:hypothetical protein